ncbi:hypothetical protein CLLU_26990 [Clostridium luticellarii]|uniref:Uncharacterized protein n=1 Tax=Clostridium luticellarii TaxID=1691940 RepID=A0A2T0BGR8_9CLOT|nr:hypothetical protein CLLU_26990 [Clostridium luticellarii]
MNSTNIREIMKKICFKKIQLICSEHTEREFL